MALRRFGDIAFDWSRVYAAQGATEDRTGRVRSVNLWIDLPGNPATSIGLKGQPALQAWNLIEADKRLNGVGLYRFDKSKICRVELPSSAGGPQGATGKITFDLGDDRAVVLEFDREIVSEVLEGI